MIVAILQQAAYKSRLYLLAGVLYLGGVSVTNAAVIALCDDAAGELKSAVETRLYSADGSALRLLVLVDDGAVDSTHCVLATFDAETSDIQWVAPLPMALRENEQAF